MRAEATSSVMQMKRCPERPGGTLGRKSKYWFKEFYNSLFGDLVNPDRIIILGTETLNLLKGWIT